MDELDLGWGDRAGWQVLRRLLELPAGSDRTTVAAAADVPPDTVSGVEQTLRDRQLDPSSAGGRVRLLDWWAATYPGPGGTTTRWQTARPVDSHMAIDATFDAYRAASHAGLDPVLSGEIAADRLAPWARPTSAVLYLTDHLDLHRIGLTRTDDPQATALQITVATDPTVHPPPHWPLQHQRAIDVDFRLADPLQILWDLHRGRGYNTDEEASVLRERLLDDLLPLATTTDADRRQQARNEAWRRHFLDMVETLDVDQIHHRWATTPDDLDQWVRDRRIFQLPDRPSFPAFQFAPEDGQPIGAVIEALAALPDRLEGWPLALWWIMPSDALHGGLPLHHRYDPGALMAAAAHEAAEWEQARPDR